MSPETSYTPYHPKWYRHRVSVWWWLQKRSYAFFVLRELTSVFVAYAAALLLWQLDALRQGPEAYAHVLVWLRRPIILALNGVALLFVVFHAITWFNLAPKAIVLRLGGKRVPDGIIAGLNYLAWMLSSGAVVYFLLRG